MNDIVITRVTRKFQITVPKKVREALSIKEGDYLAAIISGDEIILKKIEMPSWEEIFKEGEKSRKKKNITRGKIREAVREERGG
ncbi:MAG: AbrB family transcriptional regulator [Thermoplasmata archaeon]|nr:MAG: AbrB family transcriptional regulator [Thermoplasmata archaeon]RLF68466.1 MAG: AbrB family transcriptional regulator [Thermoplasmata archaeon]